MGTHFCSQKWLVIIRVGSSGASYRFLAFSRPLVSQPGRKLVLKGNVVADHGIGKGYRQSLALPLQGLASCLLLLQDFCSAYTVGMA